MNLSGDGRALLDALRRNTEQLRDRRARRPLDYISWLPGQDAFLRDGAALKLFRAGNQSQGKTWAGLAEVHFRCTGRHQYLDVTSPPIEAWVICASWSQSVAIQKKFWALTGGTGDLDPGTEFDELKGFKGKNPAVLYGNGSIVRFKTTAQGGLNLAGASIDFALFDEPPKDQRVWGEVQKRVMRRAGVVALTLTPVNAPVDWLKELCEKGVVSDNHYRLRAENLIPVGRSLPLRLGDGTPMDQDWIDKIRRETIPLEAPVVLDGEWEMRTVEQVFSAFDPRVGGHFLARLPDRPLRVCLGIDHGDGTNFSQFAVLLAVDDSGKYPRVYILDEYVSDGMTTSDMDADSVLALLDRNALEWHELDYVHGDRKHAGRRGGLGRKSNRRLTGEIADRLNLPRDRLLPAIRTVKRGRGHLQGSVSEGVGFLHRAMVRPGHFYIHSRCGRLIESLQKWDYRDTEWKHAIDGLRYALQPYIFPRKTIKRG